MWKIVPTCLQRRSLEPSSSSGPSASENALLAQNGCPQASRKAHLQVCCCSAGVDPYPTRRLADRCPCDPDGDKFGLQDKDAEDKWKFSLLKAVERARDAPLLHGLRLCVTKNVSPGPSMMKMLITSAGELTIVLFSVVRPPRATHSHLRHRHVVATHVCRRRVLGQSTASRCRRCIHYYVRRGSQRSHPSRLPHR